MKETEDKQKIAVARFVSGLIAILGLVMFFLSLYNQNKAMVITSLSYGLVMLVSNLILVFKQKILPFYISASIMVFALEISYFINGGAEGYGMIWMVIVPLLSLYLLGRRGYILMNICVVLLLMLAFWTPIKNYCSPFSPSFEVRFPITMTVEVAFGIFLKIWIEKTELTRNTYFSELTTLKENLEQQVLERTSELETERTNREKLMIELTKALAATIDAKDKYTSGHSLRVANYSKEIARRLGLSEKEQQDIYLIGLLHDIGKIGIPDEIINKTSALTDEEFEIIKGHPKVGGEILSIIETMPEMKEGARWHHERWDGKGYPDKLQGENIPVNAQIISVADSYDAMTSTRSYRAVLPQDTVRNQIEMGKGSQFNPQMADIMINLIDEDKDYVLHE